jgi:hypothetical protein
MATSLISPEQATVNLNRELEVSRGFDDVAGETRGVWNKILRRVDVVDPGPLTEMTTRHLGVFYTGLARALAFPRRLEEVTLEGKTVHYSPYSPSGGVHDGPLVTDNGFWDTFRTVYPMLSVLYPDYLGVIIQGWLNAYKEGGWLPSWASPGYRNCMVGTYADVVIADAVVKGVKGFDLDTAREALWKDSFVEPPKLSGGAVGKEGLGEYINRGYFANNGGDQVSRTLDFGFADYSVAKAFLKLASLIPEPSHSSATPDSNVKRSKLLADARTLFARSKRAQTSLFDKGQGLMVPKDENGMSSNRFHDIEWGFGFVEGNSWHHSFPPYAIENLISLHGGVANLLAKLHKLIDRSSNFMPGSYNQEIHEMTEARAFGMGQYSHNNQPVHHILYLFAQLGDRLTTEKSVRTVMEKGYGTEFYAGDEDNGEQGAWFVLSALGLFSTVPGTPDLILGSPIFRHVRIWRGKCSTKTVFGDKIINEVNCDYSYSNDKKPEKIKKSETYHLFSKKTGDIKFLNMEVYEFPVDSSYLDIVAYGPGSGVSAVAEVTFNGENLPDIVKEGGAYMANSDNKKANILVVNEKLLQNDGVLRFVMEGERINDKIPEFVRGKHVNVEKNNESDNENTKIKNDFNVKNEKSLKVILDKDSLIVSLREELKHSHAVEEELSQRLSHEKVQAKEPVVLPGVAAVAGGALGGNEGPPNATQYWKIISVTLLLLIISICAISLVLVFEYFGYIDKGDKKESYVV